MYIKVTPRGGGSEEYRVVKMADMMLKHPHVASVEIMKDDE